MREDMYNIMAFEQEHNIPIKIIGNKVSKAGIITSVIMILCISFNV